MWHSIFPFILPCFSFSNAVQRIAYGLDRIAIAVGLIYIPAAMGKFPSAICNPRATQPNPPPIANNQ